MSKATAALFLNHLKKVNRKLTPALSTSLKHSMTQAAEYGAEVEAMVGAVNTKDTDLFKTAMYERFFLPGRFSIEDTRVWGG